MSVSRYQCHCKQPDGSVKLSITLLMQLAISLVFDLQLSKGETKPLAYTTLGIDAHKQLELPRFQTLEAKRAALSCFLLTSTSAALPYVVTTQANFSQLFSILSGSDGSPPVDQAPERRSTRARSEATMDWRCHPGSPCQIAARCRQIRIDFMVRCQSGVK